MAIVPSMCTLTELRDGGIQTTVTPMDDADTWVTDLLILISHFFATAIMEVHSLHNMSQTQMHIIAKKNAIGKILHAFSGVCLSSRMIVLVGTMHATKSKG